MRKTKKILGCIGICALTLSMAFGAAGVKTAKRSSAEESWTTNTILGDVLTKEGGAKVQINQKLPDYMLARTVNGNAPGEKLWKGSDYGTLVTFSAPGDKNYVELKNPVKVSDLGTVASFVSVPSEGTWKASKVDFESLIVEIVEVNDDGSEKQNPKKVNLRYQSGAGFTAAMASRLDGSNTAEVSAYITAKSSYYEGEELKDQIYYAYANDGKTYKGRDGRDSDAPGTPRALNGGVVGISSNTQGSSKDVRTPFVFRYFEENKVDASGANYVYSYAVADTVKNIDYQKIRAFSDSRDYKTAGFTDDEAVKKGYATAGGSVDNGVTFPGFGADAKVKVRMYIDSFYNGATEAQIMVFNVANQDTFNHVNINVEYDGVTGLDFVMPDFEHIVRETVVSGGKYSEKYTSEIKKATACGENLFAEKITENADGTITRTPLTVTDGKFTPGEAGAYGMVYKYGGYQQAARVNVYETLDAPKLSGIVKPAATAENFVTDYEIFAEAKSAIYRDGATLPEIKVTFKFEGESGNTELPVKIGDFVNLKKTGFGLGKYSIVYSFTDALGRNATETVEFNYTDENRNYCYLVNGTEGEKEPFYYGLDGDIVISKNDVYCYDIIAGENFAEPDVLLADEVGNTVSITGEFSLADYLEERKAEGKSVFGDYRITYLYAHSYFALTNGAIVRTISVIDCVAPVLVPATDSYVYGAMVDKNKTTTQDTVYFNAVKNSELTFENMVAFDNVGEKYDLTGDIKLTVYKPDGSVDETVTYDPQNFKYTVNAAGEYIFRFSVSDSVTLADGTNAKNLESVLVYVIDVADNFYTVKLLSEYGVKDTATSFKTSDFTVTDFYGTPVSAVKTVKAFDENGKEVWSAGAGEVKNFELSGAYTVKHIATVNGASIGEVDVKVVIADKTKPVITVKGDIYKKTIVGREIPLAGIIATDNEGVKSLVTDVTLNGNIVNVYNGKFTPITAGEYTVKVTATDINDNVSVYEYVIAVEEDKVGGFANFMNRFGLIFAIVFGVLTAAGAVTFVLLKNNKLVKKQDKGE